MTFLYQTYQKDKWATIGTLAAQNDGSILRIGMGESLMGTEPIWSDSLNREVMPNEGKVYLTALEQGGCGVCERLINQDEQ